MPAVRFGKYSKRVSSCESCEAGKFGGGGISSSCQLCYPGLYSQKGAASCSLCDAGKLPGTEVVIHAAVQFGNILPKGRVRMLILRTRKIRQRRR